jgi:Flp pilus assembly protein TadG
MRILAPQTNRQTTWSRQIEGAAQVNLERISRRCRLNRQGAAAVEFALVAPLFFLMVFGMIEFGRAIMVQQLLTNAVREGARVGVLDSPTPTAPQVTSAVTNYLANGGVSGATVTMNPSEPTTAGYGATVTVTASIPYSSVSWIPPIFIGGSRRLTATSTMRRETVQ